MFNLFTEIGLHRKRVPVKHDKTFEFNRGLTSYDLKEVDKCSKLFREKIKKDLERCLTK